MRDWTFDDWKENLAETAELVPPKIAGEDSSSTTDDDSYKYIEARLRALPQAGSLPSLLPLLQQTKQNTDHETTARSMEGLIQITINAANTYHELIPNDLDFTELVVETIVGQILLDLFETVAIDEVSLRFTSDSTAPASWIIRIQARCPLQSCKTDSGEQKNTEMLIGVRVSSALTELFGTVNVEQVGFYYVPWEKPGIKLVSDSTT